MIFSVFFMITIMVSSIATQGKKIFFKVEIGGSQLKFCELERTLFGRFKPHFSILCDEHRFRRERKIKTMLFMKEGKSSEVCLLSEDEKGVDELMTRFCERH